MLQKQLPISKHLSEDMKSIKEKLAQYLSILEVKEGFKSADFFNQIKYI
jgi:hypothetical protein